MWQLIIPAITSILGKLVPDPAERARMQLQLLQMQSSGDLAELQAAVSIIVAESSGNWLQRSWRPVVMLTFAGLVVARWLGFAAPDLAEAEYLKLWDIVQLGLGGYVVGRSVEKTVPAVAEVLREWKK